MCMRLSDCKNIAYIDDMYVHMLTSSAVCQSVVALNLIKNKVENLYINHGWLFDGLG